MYRPITSGSVRAARGYLGWDRKEFAKKAGISQETLRNIETRGVDNMTLATLAKVLHLIEGEGIKITVEDDDTVSMTFKRVA